MREEKLAELRPEDRYKTLFELDRANRFGRDFLPLFTGFCFPLSIIFRVRQSLSDVKKSSKVGFFNSKEVYPAKLV